MAIGVGERWALGGHGSFLTLISLNFNDEWAGGGNWEPVQLFRDQIGSRDAHKVPFLAAVV